MIAPHKPISFGVDGPSDGTFYQGYVRMTTILHGKAMVTYRRTKTFADESKAWDAAEQLYRDELRKWNRANGTP